eukprot:6167563-Lingulodinium_polyedra.AAC.1
MPTTRCGSASCCRSSPNRGPWTERVMRPSWPSSGQDSCSPLLGGSRATKSASLAGLAGSPASGSSTGSGTPNSLCSCIWA